MTFKIIIKTVIIIYKRSGFRNIPKNENGNSTKRNDIDKIIIFINNLFSISLPKNNNIFWNNDKYK